MKGAHPSPTKIYDDTGLGVDEGDGSGAGGEPVQRGVVLMVLGYQRLVTGDCHFVADIVSSDKFECEGIDCPSVIWRWGTWELNPYIRFLSKPVHLPPPSNDTYHLLPELPVSHLHALQSFQIYTHLNSLANQESSSSVDWLSKNR